MEIEEKGTSHLVQKLQSHVKSKIDEFGLVGAKLIVAVSGGADSQTLLHVLDSIKDNLSLTLHGAHFNHGLRVPDSDSDAQIVKELFEKYHMDFSIESASLKNIFAGRSSTLETTARQFRYDFFYKIVVQEKADAIILGHTSDDQAETVIMNIFRGTGLQGLQGMRYLSAREKFNHNFVIFRPLLETSHKENLSYCKILNICPLEDPTNSSIIPRRNWIRNSLFESVKKFYPNIVPSLTRLAAMAQEDYRLIDSLVNNEWENILSNPIYPSLNLHPSISLNITQVKSLNPSIQRQLLRRAYLTLAGRLENLTYNHIEQVFHVLLGESGKACFLPQGIQAINEYDTITFYKNQNPHRDCAQIKPIEVKVPGETILSKEWSIKTSYLPRRLPVNPKQGKLSAFFKATLGETKLIIRSRSANDKFQSLGMVGSKRLNRYLIDQKIPRNRRCCLPVLTSDNSIAWIGGLQIAEWAKVICDEPILLVQLKSSRLQNQTQL